MLIYILWVFLFIFILGKFTHGKETDKRNETDYDDTTRKKYFLDALLTIAR